MHLILQLNFDQLSYVKKVNESQVVGFMMLRFGIDDIMNTTNLIDNEGNVDYNNIELFSSLIMLFYFLTQKKMYLTGLMLVVTLKLFTEK